MPEVKLAKENGGALANRPEAYFPAFPFGNLFGASPFKIMKRFTEEMDRTLANFAGPFEMELWAPPLEVLHKDGRFIVTVELPGIPKEDVKVDVLEDALVIEGERKLAKEKKEEGFFKSERSYGKFSRTIPLPKGAKTEDIKAELNHGVLEVVIPLPEVKPNTRHVPIRAV